MNLDVRIKTTAEGQGAQQTADGLKKAADNADLLKAKLAQAAQTNASYTAESDRVSKSAKQSAAAFKELLDARDQETKAVEESTRAEEKWTISKGQAIGALKKLKDAIPGLGYAIDLLKNPYAVAAAAIGTFIYAIQQQIAAQKELEDESNTLITKLGEAERTLGRQSESWDEVTKSAREYLQALQDLKEEQTGLDVQTKQAIKQIDAQAKVDSAQARAIAAEEESRIELAVEQGRLTPITARTRKRVVQSRLQGKLIDISQRATRAKAGAVDMAAMQREEQAVDVEAMLPGAMESAQQLDVRAANVRKLQTPLIEQGQKTVTDLQRQIEETRGKIAGLGAEIADAVANPTGGRFQGQRDFLKGALQTEQNRLMSLEQSLGSEQQLIERRQVEIKQSDVAASDARTRVQTLRSQSIAARRAAGRFAGEGVDFRLDFETTKKEEAAVRDLEAQKLRNQQMVDASQEVKNATKAAEQAVINALKEIGFSQRAIEAQAKAQGGR